MAELRLTQLDRLAGRDAEAHAGFARARALAEESGARGVLLELKADEGSAR